MQIISQAQASQTAGGIPWLAPVTVAMVSDSAILGPLGFAFGVGYGIGTFIYHNWIE